MKSTVVINRLPDYRNSWNNELGFLFKEIEEASIFSEIGTQYLEMTAQRFLAWEGDQYNSDRTTEVPGHHENSRSRSGSRIPQQPQRQTAPQHNQPPERSRQPHQPQQPTQPPNPPTPPQEPKPESSTNDQISKILEVQNKALHFMNEVENFTGTKKDQKYIYITEMLTQCLINLDKILNCMDDVRTAKEDAIRSINRCINVLEIKAPDEPAEQPASENTGPENHDPENENPQYYENGKPNYEEPMHVDNNGENPDSPGMDVDGAYGQ